MAVPILIRVAPHMPSEILKKDPQAYKLDRVEERALDGHGPRAPICYVVFFQRYCKPKSPFKRFG